MTNFYYHAIIAWIAIAIFFWNIHSHEKELSSFQKNVIKKKEVFYLDEVYTSISETFEKNRKILPTYELKKAPQGLHILFSIDNSKSLEKFLQIGDLIQSNINEELFIGVVAQTNSSRFSEESWLRNAEKATRTISHLISSGIDENRLYLIGLNPSRLPKKQMQNDTTIILRIHERKNQNHRTYGNRTRLTSES